MTEVWPIEGVALGAPGMVANSLADRMITTESDVADIKSVTDNIPDGGSMSDIADIKAVTDNLPDSGALTGISDETDKIDGATTDGLAGTNNSLAYRVHEIERHFHSYERWFETAAAPNGEIHVADAIGSGSGSFRLDADNDDWGGWVQLLGSSDTPAIAGSAKFDFHRISIEAVEREATYFIQIAVGASGAGAFAAGDYSELVYIPLTNKKEPGPVNVQMRRADVGAKVWARCMCPGQNTATLDLYHGLHEYEG